MRNFTHKLKRAMMAVAALFFSLSLLSLQNPVTTALTTALAAAESNPTAPTIAVSIKPLHSLVSAVTEGVIEPVLLFDGFSSPHTTQLKPSTLRQLRESDLLVWVGAGVEVYLARVIADLDAQMKVITFGQIDGLQRLPFRFDQHNHGHGEQAEAVHHSAGEQDADKRDADKHQTASGQSDAEHSDTADYHVWLDPHNGKQLVLHLAETLADIDPANAQRYESNAKQLLIRLDQVDQQLVGLLGEVSDVPYLVFHDSFQYMEHRYGLHRALVIAEQPEVQPGARRLKQILRRVEATNVKCLFSEPQFPAKVVSMLQRDSSVDVATLDPLASRYDAGPELYPLWMLELGQTMHECLTR